MSNGLEGLFFYVNSNDHYQSGQVLKALSDSIYLVQYEMSYATGLDRRFCPLEPVAIEMMLFQKDCHWSFFTSEEQLHGYMEWLNSPMTSVVKVVPIKGEKK